MATYTFDAFCTVDGFGSYNEDGDWGGYWGKQTQEFLDHRLAQYRESVRLVLGANPFRSFQRYLGGITPESAGDDPVNAAMKFLPTTVLSTTLTGPLDWPDATLVAGDVVDAVARLKEQSSVSLRSHGSLRLNRALMAAGLVDIVQLTVFPVISGTTGSEPIFAGAADFDLELLGSTTFDGGIAELIYRPTRRS